MNKVYLFFFLLYFLCINIKSYSLEKIIDIKNTWSISFVDEKSIIISEKSGNLFLLNIKEKKIINIKHNLKVSSLGQGSLMDVIYYDNKVWLSYSERVDNKSTTSVALGKLNNNEISFINIFRAKPLYSSTYHYGSRIVIDEDFLYVSVGDRGQGMIAQDYKTHPGSIIRIYKNGKIPKDNPKFNIKPSWLPEIYQIGHRNPQGLALSKKDKRLYATNHGAKGGDWFGEITKGGNYGWKILGWGGKNYIGTKIGPPWKKGFSKPIKYWVPSIGISSLVIYDGKEFPLWKGNALITSLKDKSLRRIIFDKEGFLEEQILIQDLIGRIRDIEVHPKNGSIFLLGESSLWKLSAKENS